MGIADEYACLRVFHQFLHEVLNIVLTSHYCIKDAPAPCQRFSLPAIGQHNEVKDYPCWVKQPVVIAPEPRFTSWLCVGFVLLLLAIPQGGKT